MIKKFASLVLMVAVIAMNFGFMATNVADAAQVTVLSDVVSNLSASAVANHTITFTSPTGLASGATLILTFDNSTSIDASMTFADIDFRYGATDVTLAAAPSGATMGVVRTSPTVITFTNGTTVIAGGQVIVIKIGTNTTIGGVGTKQITNGPVGTTLLRIGGTFNDAGAISLPIIANSIVAISAEVLSALSFTVSSNAIYFGNLRTTGNCFAQNTNPGYVTCPTTTETEAFNMTAGTNATSGYTISVQGPTLTSGANTIANLVTNTAASFGNEQFGLRMTASGGTGAVDALYSAAGFAFNGVASPSPVASVGAPSSTTTYSVRYLANISALTKAGSYTTNHTYIATGNF
jgi:hypothetical protein